MVPQDEFLKACEEIRLNLYDWQKEIIFDTETKQFCILCGRKAGKTQAVSLRIAWQLLNDDVRGVGVSGGIGLTGIEMKSIKAIVSDVKNILTALGWTFSKEKRDMDETNKTAYATTTEIYMPGGNRLVAMASGYDGDSIRPFSWHTLIYDESDFLPDEVFTSTLPCLARFNGVEILLSTPNTKGDRETHTAKAFFGQLGGYKIYHIPSARKRKKTFVSNAAHISNEWIERMHSSKTKAEFAREILAQYINDEALIFKSDHVHKAKFVSCDWDAPEAIYLGVYYARLDMENNVIAFNHVKGGISSVRIKVIPNEYGRFQAMEEEIDHIMTTLPITKMVVDTKILGTGPIETLQAKYGPGVVVGVSSHEIKDEIEGERKRYMKEDLYLQFAALLELGKIFYEDQKIMQALLDVSYDYSKTNNKVYIHGNDVVEALVRSVFPVWGKRVFIGDISRDLFKTIKL